ncbi:MAG: LdpA C-terminal domain-containing domain [Elusimicrobiales bacterium]|nr:LdpA C-terminal domain-containing domain [Elusimicrobiales bacterium]
MKKKISKGLAELLEKRKCFKLVCGAGNEDAAEVEKLVYLYASAGANYFDLSAKEEVVLAAGRGLERAGKTHKEKFLNVSVGIKGDPHVSKAVIGSACICCGKCLPACQVQHAILRGKPYKVQSKRCIGCGACAKVCPEKAITIVSAPKPLSKVLPPLLRLGLDSFELHAVTQDEESAFSQWKELESDYGGMLSLCIDRSRLGDKQLLARINRFMEKRAPGSTIIQADGAPMSGCDDFASTTLQALATAQIVYRSALPVYLMLSGGTNSKTAKLAKFFGIRFHGVALGSYARKIVSRYIDREDFLTNKAVFSKARTIAEKLVNSSLRYMG